jgi:hypothetical protein
MLVLVQSVEREDAAPVSTGGAAAGARQVLQKKSRPKETP